MSDGADTAATVEHEVVLRDGRVLEMIRAGPPDGVAVVFHHGTPFSAVAYRPARGVRARDARLLSWSRPGYAGSTRRPRRVVADVAADTAQVLDCTRERPVRDDRVVRRWSPRPGVRRPVPERCAAATIIAGVAPYDAAGLDWLDGMGPENIEEFRVGRRRWGGVLRLPGPRVAAIRSARRG